MLDWLLIKISKFTMKCYNGLIGILLALELTWTTMTMQLWPKLLKLLTCFYYNIKYISNTIQKPCVHENVISKSVQLILSHPSQNRLTAIILFKRCVHVSHYMDPIVSHSYTGYIFNNTLLLYHFYKLRLSHQNFFGAYNVKICG